MTVRRRWAGPAGALLALGLLAGCGGGSSGGKSADPAVPAFGTAAPTAGVAAPGAPAGSAAPAAADTTATKVVPGQSLYMVLTLKGWELDQAVRPTGKGRAQAQRDDRSLDWTAAYDQPDSDESVTLNGHLRGLAGQTAVLRKQGGGTVQTGDVNGRPAAWVDQSGGNVVVLIALSPTYTVELVAEGATLDGALTVARALTPVDLAGWKAAGGREVDCLAAGADCIN